MIEKTFIDRVPVYPGRVILAPVAGQTNVYDMTRADEPTEVGTPLNRATFDSMTKSRLTGRFYQPEVYSVAVSSVSGTVNPIPTSGWINATATGAKNGAYVLSASSSVSASYGPAAAFNGCWATNAGWQSASGDAAPWISVDLGSAVIVTKIKTHYTATNTATTCSVEGSNDGAGWTPLATIGATQSAAAETSISNSTAYRYYRLSFNNTGVKLFGWALTGYTFTTYTSMFTVGGWPAEWTVGQRATVLTPATESTLGTVSNTINGVAIDTILLPGKRYELRYTGTAFVAKEV